MENFCKDCKQICKKLDNGEQPIHYIYTYLNPANVIEICQHCINVHAAVFLESEESAVSFGNQLAVLLKPTDTTNLNSDTSDTEIVFIIQAELDQNTRTNMWIRYGTPRVLCAKTAVVTELTILIQKILYELKNAEDIAREKYHL